MKECEFFSTLHNRTQRNYIQRVIEHDKAESSEVAIKYGKDYWDGERRYGYGGYSYDGRWKVVAEKMISFYKLNSESKILDVGCGKGFLLYEFTQLLPGVSVRGVDISTYAIENSKEEVRPLLKSGNATELPFENGVFDLVISMTTLHNLHNYELKKALQEIQRVSKKDKYISVESYRTEKEKMNLLYWQLTCRSFYRPEEWIWAFNEAKYDGDYEFIYFQ
jgi:ubiquinone/menaquinone biosynthesis C-methylase UbiE